MSDTLVQVGNYHQEIGVSAFLKRQNLDRKVVAVYSNYVTILFCSLEVWLQNQK